MPVIAFSHRGRRLPLADDPPVLFIFALFIAFTNAEERVEFNREIRPILTKHCTACHGGVKEAGEISFIYREKALAPGKSGKIPIVPGMTERVASCVLRMIPASLAL